MHFFRVQCLYTTVEGERRVRVCNLALNVVEMAGISQFAEFEATVCHMAWEGKKWSGFSVDSSGANVNIFGSISF